MHIELVNDGQNLALIPEVADDAVLADLAAVVIEALVKAGYQVEDTGEIDFSPMERERTGLMAIAQREYFENLSR